LQINIINNFKAIMDVGCAPKILFMWDKSNTEDEIKLTEELHNKHLSNIVVISENLHVEHKNVGKWAWFKFG